MKKLQDIYDIGASSIKAVNDKISVILCKYSDDWCENESLVDTDMMTKQDVDNYVNLSECRHHMRMIMSRVILNMPIDR